GAGNQPQTQGQKHAGKDHGQDIHGRTMELHRVYSGENGHRQGDYEDRQYGGDGEQADRVFGPAAHFYRPQGQERRDRRDGKRDQRQFHGGVEVEKQGGHDGEGRHDHGHGKHRNQQGPGMAEKKKGVPMGGLQSDGEYGEKQADLEYEGDQIAPL